MRMAITTRLMLLVLTSGLVSNAQRAAMIPARSLFSVITESPVLLPENRIGFSALQVSQGNTIWAVGKYKNRDGMFQKGVVLCSNDAGFTWKEKLVAPDAFFNDVFFVNLRLGWVVGSGHLTTEGTIFKTTDGGESWTQQKPPFNSMFLQIQFLDERKGWVLGYLGDLLYTKDGGVTWHNYKFHQVVFEKNKFYGMLRKFHFCDDLNGWVVGEQGKIYQSTDGGVSWQDQFSEIDKLFKNRQNLIVDFYDVKFFTPHLGFVIAQVSSKNDIPKVRKMTYLKTENGGKSWSIVNSISNSWLTKSHILNEKEAWAQIHSYEVVHTIDAGKTWRKIIFPRDSGIQSSPLLYSVSGNIWLVPDSDTFFSTALRSNDEGNKWEKHLLKYIEK
jgi:photosystem II stability/assembly factor-like uncharacterized protein